ncbi:ubiquinol-cytochrome c reductase cytochrome c subunit [Pseudonocardia sediminis]|uniref:Cytochrome bc1 complex cytochrome c subunit n=1 Tax=Pseudonocardia sediminis TaxID=1397368 RepID=A0A4Q7UTA0_PSEST|nr:cytochrome c [Pseudonocardia sediminis]RZT85127.1 ubiquinol-cytochrome c reductase cytochrome c subunit [Pseudonocardia sediminis]
MTESPSTKTRPHGKLRRRMAGILALGVALLAVGGAYAAFAPEPQTANAQPDAALIAKGQELYNNTCITCHGSNLQGVTNRGPSLIGVGDAAVYFQVSSGRMPMARQEAQAERKNPLPEFDPAKPEGQANLEALGAYIQANGGGPQTPAVTGAALRGDDPGRGGQLFRLNCASCHNFTGVGGALSSGKYAPALAPASEEQIYTAMLSGPQNMPRFSDQQLTPQEKQDIIAYVKSVSDGGNNVGGYAAGGIGPTSEGILVFIVGMAGLIGFAMWLGAKS